MRLLVTGGSGFIGTNLMAEYIPKGIPLINVDWNTPLDPSQKEYWTHCNIMDHEKMHAIFQEFQPTHVVHLAARADTDEKEDMRGYAQNHEGTKLLWQVINDTPSVQHTVITSTQFVCEAGYQPAHDQDYKPFTLYGESKRLTEVHTRDSAKQGAWTIIRPTTIWGPWSLRYRDIMFKVMRKGLYFHPSKKEVIRSYGYVGNVVWQISRILEGPTEAMHQKVFYVGDRPIDLKLWVDAISRELTGRPVRYIPTWMVRSIAMGGDAFKVVGIPFPITSGRYRSMISDYITPMDHTIEALGEAPHDLSASVKRTIDWYRKVSQDIIAHTLKDVRQLEEGSAA